MTPSQQEKYNAHKEFIDQWIRERVPHLSREAALTEAFAKLHLPTEPFTGRTTRQRQEEERRQRRLDIALAQEASIQQAATREAESQTARELREAREYLADLRSRYDSVSYNPTLRSEAGNLERRIERARSAIRAGEERLAQEEAVKMTELTLAADAGYALARSLAESDESDELVKGDITLQMEHYYAKQALLTATPENARQRVDTYKQFSKKLVDLRTLSAIAKSQEAEAAALAAVKQAAEAGTNVVKLTHEASKLQASNEQLKHMAAGSDANG